jgi:tripartite motif-containing protein 71
MDRKRIIAAAALWALTAVCAWGSWEYAGQWGQFGNWPEHFRAPTGIAVRANGNVYVCDLSLCQVKYFTSTGSFLGYWGSKGSGPGQFNEPCGAAFGRNGYLYVVEKWNDRVQYFTATGSFLGSWGSYGIGDGQFDWPHGIGIGPNGYVYVADYGNHRVQYFTPTGSFLGKWGSWGQGPGEVGYLWGVSCAPNGNVYIPDGTNNRVQYFTSSGSFRGLWNNTPYYQPHNIDVAPDGTVFTSCVGDDLEGVKYFTPTGSLLGSFGGEGSGPGQFDFPSDLEVNGTGTTLYIADQHNARIQYFRRNEPKIEPTSLGRVKAIYR